MLSRRQVYLLAAFFVICSLYVFESTFHIKETVVSSNPFTRKQQSPQNLPDQKTKPVAPQSQPIVITLVLMGRLAAQEGLVTIKSAIMHSSRPLDIHLICSEDAIDIIQPKVQLIQRPYYPLNVFFHVVSPERVRERLERADIGTINQNWFMLSKLLMHEILVGIEKTIFVDTDMIFVVDPLQLWDGFGTLDGQALLALPTLGPKSHPGEICTCVMLMHLERMRNPEPDTILIPSSLIPGHKDLLTIPLASAERDGVANYQGGAQRLPYTPKDAPFGDQGIFYPLWYYRRDLFAHLSLRWDITQCRSSYGLRLWGFLDKDGNRMKDDSMMSEDEHISHQTFVDRVGADLVVPGILHFNCLPDATNSNVWDWPESHDAAIRTWAPMVTTAVRYKWVWLNRGNGSAVTTIAKTDGIQWLDEKIKGGNDTPRRDSSISRRFSFSRKHVNAAKLLHRLH